MEKNPLPIYQSIRNNIEAGKIENVYFFGGEELYFGDRLADLLQQKVVDPAMRDFNEIILYGADTTAGAVVEACMQFPMMADKSMVILREASKLKSWDNLIPYLKKPQPSTVLVIIHPGKLDGRKEISKVMKKEAKVYFEVGELYEDKLQSFINFRLQEMQRRATPESIKILCDFLGSDLHRIENEIHKLVNNINENDVITPELIEEYVGISKIYNSFEFGKAILMRDVPKAHNIAKVFEANPKLGSILSLVPLLYSYFSKLLILHAGKITQSNEAAKAIGISPYFVGDYLTGKQRYSYSDTLKAITILRKYDGYSKGVGGNANPRLLTQLICEIAM
jgi:DNA polymerase III subunit delta